MKKIFGLCLIASVWACSNETPIKQDDINETKIDSTNTTKPAKDTLNAPITAVQENPLTIEDFPKKWFKLDPIDENSEEYVINKYCEAETQQLWIEQEDNGWFVYVLYGQDGQKYKIIEFEAYEEERELYQVMYGTFILENPDYPDMDVELYDFMWNKDLMFCNFNGFFQDEAMMVSEQNKDNYGLIEENCDYLEDM